MAEETSRPTYEDRPSSGDRLFSPSAGRNRDAIAVVFAREMPTKGAILELGSGTGEHGVHLATTLPGVDWYPSEQDRDALTSIEAWRRHSGRDNLHPPIKIDVSAPDWPVSDIEPLHGMMSANMIHIAPWEVAEGLFAGASRHLASDGALFLYGPFRREGQHTAQSNADFDASLKARNSDWGVRDLEQEVVPLALGNGLAVQSITEMPANNLSVVFRRVPV